MFSAIYTGKIRHRRFFPKQHEFSYDAILFYIDLEELPHLFSDVSGWSLNKSNFGCFKRSDYFGDPEVPLDIAVRNQVVKLLGFCPTGPIRMLTNLRIMGLCFNPVTFYYLFEPNEELPSVIMAEVNNTPWNERHTYAIFCNKESGKTLTEFDKAFHVSPFNPIAMQYAWVSTAPAESLLVHMENLVRNRSVDASAGGDACLCHMDATLTLNRQAWARPLLRKILWRFPWLTLKVPVAIYWQALKLFIKSVPVYGHTSVKVDVKGR